MNLISLLLFVTLFVHSEKIGTLRYKGKEKEIFLKDVKACLKYARYEIQYWPSKEAAYDCALTMLAMFFLAEESELSKNRESNDIDDILDIYFEEQKKFITDKEINDEYDREVAKYYSHQLMVIELPNDKAIDVEGSFEEIAESISVHSSKNNGGSIGIHDYESISKLFGEDVHFIIYNTKEGFETYPIEKEKSGSFLIFRVVKRMRVKDSFGIEKKIPELKDIKEKLIYEINLKKLMAAAKSVEIIKHY